MFVLGIDPGLSRCGYGCVGRAGGRLVPVAGGVLTTDPSDPMPQRLAALADDLAQLFDEFSPDVVAVERVFFQVNVRTAMSVGQASGLAMVAAARAGCPVVQYSPNEVKLAVAGDGGASKAEIQRMIQVLLGLPSLPRPPDVADALALAVCHLAAAPVAQAAAAAMAGAGRPAPGRGGSR